MQYHNNAPLLCLIPQQYCSPLHHSPMLSELGVCEHYGTQIAIHDQLNLSLARDCPLYCGRVEALEKNSFYTCPFNNKVAWAMTLEESHVRADSESDQRK